ncbi:MAG: hydrogenase maturation protease [Caldiserica bacterium]|nr:hydrogenase maturation protease [Caldisericota bacterium]
MGSSRHASAARAVIALGNPYRTDDGVGIALLRLLDLAGGVSRVARDDVELIEGVHGGFRLAEAMVGYGRVLVVDAAPWLPAGEVRRVPLGGLPARAGYPHGLGLRAALEALAAAGEEIPEVEVLAIGIPGDPAFGEGLSPEVKRALPRALAEVARWLTE